MHIEIQALSKLYDGGRGLLPLNLSVPHGEFVAVVGHNGAGKSTLLKMLARWIQPDTGDVLVDGMSIRNRLASVRSIGFVPEVPNLYEQFSVSYNLAFYARLFALPRSRIDEVLRELDLEKFSRSKVHALSKGLRQRVSLARSLLADPSVLLLDEPTSGLDFEISKELYRRLKDLHVSGKTIIFTSHRPEEIKMLATRIIVLHAGNVVFDGSPDAYFQSKAHQDLYS